MPSFDVISEVDRHELTNAVDQANRELQQRNPPTAAAGAFPGSPDGRRHGGTTLGARSFFCGKRATATGARGASVPSARRSACNHLRYPMRIAAHAR